MFTVYVTIRTLNVYYCVIYTGTKINAYFDSHYLTIRHSNCDWLIQDLSHSDRCSACSQYRDSYLRSKLRSLQTRTDEMITSSCSVNSHTNYRYLDTPEKLKRMRNLRALVTKQRRRLSNLEEKLEHHVRISGVRIQEDIRGDITDLLEKYSENVSGDNNEESFKSIFWNQQIKNLALKDKRQIRWHPLLIRWALYLHYKSSGGYETLRKSGIITLPSSRTLRDYRHFTPTKSGFSNIADIQLQELIQQKRSHLAKYVFILIDEMHLKEGLVYDKGSGYLVGFCDLGDVVQQLHDFEEKLSSDTPVRRPLAKTMMVFMVRGVFTSIKFPYAQFPMTSGTGYDLFPILWQAIDRLECNGVHVLGITADGASINRKLFKLHGVKDDSLVYKTCNVYSKEKREIFSDPPHLLQAIRNAFASPTRHLWVSKVLDNVCINFNCYYTCFHLVQ